jgi:hypothetical protein
MGSFLQRQIEISAPQAAQVTGGALRAPAEGMGAQGFTERRTQDFPAGQLLGVQSTALRSKQPAADSAGALQPGTNHRHVARALHATASVTARQSPDSLVGAASTPGGNGDESSQADEATPAKRPITRTLRTKCRKRINMAGPRMRVLRDAASPCANTGPARKQLQ